MRIAIFSSTINRTNGYGNITYELCRSLKKKGVNFKLFLPKKEEKSGVDREFDISYELPDYIFKVYTPKLFSYFRVPDISEFDLVHSLFAFPYAFTAALSAKRYRKPLMVGAQGTYGVQPLTYAIERVMLKLAYNHAGKIVVPSEYTKKTIRHYSGIEYPISVIHNGVNYERFQKKLGNSSIEEKYKNNFLIMTVGGLKKRKGQDLVIKALGLIGNEVPNIKYLVVGSGGMRSELKNLAAELGVSDKVEFLGLVKDDDLVRLFQLCDIYVHTPVMDSLRFEGFGIVYLEGGAAGTPSVATISGGIEDAVVDNKTGLLFEEGDSEGIASGILKLYKDESLLRELGKGAQIYAKNHDWSIITDKYVSFYESLLHA